MINERLLEVNSLKSKYHILDEFEVIQDIGVLRSMFGDALDSQNETDFSNSTRACYELLK